MNSEIDEDLMTITPPNETDDTDAGRCIITLVPFKDIPSSNIFILACGHKYDKEALILTLKAQTRLYHCPLCRHRVHPHKLKLKLPRQTEAIRMSGFLEEENNTMAGDDDSEDGDFACASDLNDTEASSDDETQSPDNKPEDNEDNFASSALSIDDLDESDDDDFLPYAWMY